MSQAVKCNLFICAGDICLVSQHEDTNAEFPLFQSWRETLATQDRELLPSSHDEDY